MQEIWFFFILDLPREYQLNIALLTFFTADCPFSFVVAAERQCICPSPMVGSGEPPTLPPEPPGGMSTASHTHPSPHTHLPSPPQAALCLNHLLEEHLCVCLTLLSSIALFCVTIIMSFPLHRSTPIIADKTPSFVGRTLLDSYTLPCLNAQVSTSCLCGLTISDLSFESGKNLTKP